jgi:hypothetical protein
MAAFPTIHLNGTSKEALLEQQLAAIKALRAATDALSAAAPHGRDYYVQGPLAFTVARDEHVARLTKITEVIREIEALALHISEAA